MSPPTLSLAWFGRHELRLFWRDWIAMLTAGKRRREGILLAVAIIFVVGAHLLAYFLVSPFAKAGIAPDKATLVVLTGSILLSVSMMISQAMESVTRAFYARDDLDLILSSPASASRIFAVRMVAIMFSAAALTMLLAGPFINALAMVGGPRWLAGYGVILGLGAASTGFALMLTVALFRVLGPKRTRLISQIVSAVVGATFVIGIQVAAILSAGTISRLSFLGTDGVVDRAPDLASLVWWPARAAMGDVPAVLAVLAVGLGLLASVISLTSARFADYVTAAAGVSYGDTRRRRRRAGFRPAATGATLRRKEWVLLWRDPWLLSQSLMQILYLLPPALMLWIYYGTKSGAILVAVPVLVMATGQLAGGLAWLAVSGEDAPDLVASAPITERAIIRAKIEAVLVAVVLVAVPLIVGLALASPKLAAVAGLGVVLAAVSSTLIQIWFRSQARRSQFRRRQTSSRIATLAEVLSSILWAASAALAATGSAFAIVTAVIAVMGLTCVWAIRPRRDATA